MGFSNTFATIPGIVSPIISGYIVITPVRYWKVKNIRLFLTFSGYLFQSVEEWQIVFYITSGIYLFGCAFYGIFASGKLQPWALESQQPERKGTNNNEAHNNAFIPDV